MEPPSCSLELINETANSVKEKELIQAVTTAFSIHRRSDASACLLLTGDEQIHELNLRFRSVDAATDVLTFPSGEENFLGDVAISVPYATRQAEARGVPLDDELSFLAIHGALHLLGFDDETEADRAEMVDEMNKVAVAIGLKPDLEWASILHGELP